MEVKRMIDFHPKFIDAMKSYSRAKFAADVMAGIIVGVVAIPLAIAFGIASGVGPAEGLVTAIIAGVLISLLGGSKVQIAHLEENSQQFEIIPPQGMTLLLIIAGGGAFFCLIATCVLIAEIRRHMKKR